MVGKVFSVFADFVMSLGEQSTKERGLDVMERVVLVAVKASREISRISLVWALAHIVHPGDCVKLLVVIPVQSSGKLPADIHISVCCKHTNDTHK